MGGYCYYYLYFEERDFFCYGSCGVNLAVEDYDQLDRVSDCALFEFYFFCGEDVETG